MQIPKILNPVIITGLVLALFIPFMVFDGNFFPFITGKGFFFRILVEILLGLWAVLIFWDASIRPKFSWIFGSAAAFIGIIAIADLAGVDFYRSFWSNFERMDGLVTLLHLFVYFIVAGSVLNSRLKWHVFLNVSVFASVVMSLYAFLQLSGNIVINQGGVRVDGTLGNATYLAVYMLFNIFIALFLLLRVQLQNTSAKWFISAWCGVALVFQLIVLYATATRGAILGLIGGLFLSSLYLAIFGKDRPALRKISIGLIAGLFLLIGGFFAVRNAEFVTNSPTLSRFASLSVEDISKQGRRYVWPMAIQGFKEKPILGWGQENFNYVFNKYYDPRMYNQEPWFDRAHNVVLDWLVAGGIVGLLGYLGMFVALLWLVVKSKTLTIADKAIVVGLTAAYFFQNLFVFDNLISYIYFFSLLAFVHADTVQGKPEPVWYRRIYSLSWTKVAVPIAAALVVVVLVYGLNIKAILANRTLLQAIITNKSTPEQSLENFKKVYEYDTFANTEATEQLANQSQRFSASTVSDETKKMYIDFAAQQIDLQIERTPRDARELLFAGSFFSRGVDQVKGLQYLERASEQSPKKQTILFEIGLAKLGQNDFSGGLEALKTAFDLNPEFTEARILYAIGALYNKNEVLARELLSSLAEDQVIRDERLVAAFASTGHLAEAVEFIERRVMLDPQDPAIRFRLAAGYLGLNQRTKAVETLRDIVKEFPAQKSQAEYYIKEIQAGRNP